MESELGQPEADRARDAPADADRLGGEAAEARAAPATPVSGDAAAGESAGRAASAASEAGELRLRPPRHRVDARAVRWWTAQALAIVVPLVAALAVVFVLAPGARGWSGAGLVAAGVLGGAYVVVMPRWRYRVHRWETTPEAVYASSGWLLQEWRVAPLSRVQTVDTLRGPLQQLFGLATVTVTTASAKGEIKIDGLDSAHAVEVVRHLTETTQATPGDAT